MDEFDRAHVAGVLARVLTFPGGAEMVVESLSTIPGVIYTPAKSGFFHSSPASVRCGVWRYSQAEDGRLAAAHVVEGIVLSEERLAPAQGSAHVASALLVHIRDVGPHVVPDMLAVIEGLEVAAG